MNFIYLLIAFSFRKKSKKKKKGKKRKEKKLEIWLPSKRVLYFLKRYFSNFSLWF